MIHPIPPRESPDDVNFLPPHAPTAVAGFHAYSHRMGATTGDDVDLRVSGQGKVDVSVVRYGATIDQFTEVARLPSIEARLHPIHRGSYAYVEGGVPLGAAFAIEVWCRPIGEQASAGLISTSQWRLWLSDGQVRFTTADGADLLGPATERVVWHYIVVCCDGRECRLYVNGIVVAKIATNGRGFTQRGALRLGAGVDGDGRTHDCFSCDLCAPTLYPAPLSDEAIARRFKEKLLDPESACLAHWKFDAIDGAPYRDTSGNAHHSRPVNYPIRMIPGPRRTDDSDWSTYDPTRDPDFGHAVRFMSDSVVDCRWPVAATWRVPNDLRSGQYGFRLTNATGEVRHVPFIVRPSKPTGVRIMCLSTTNTRVCYNFRAFGNPQFDYGAYFRHPTYKNMLGHLMGARRPATFGEWPPTTVTFELPFYAWLDREGIAYDLYTEWDLEADPSLLDHYSAVAWAGHSEYWTRTMYESLKRFAHRGGHILAMSGNTAYWRVSVDLKNQVVEVRKHARVTTPGTTCDPVVNSAHFHQIDHLPGATMREAGLPESGLLHAVTNGYTHPPLNGPRAGYEVLAPQHWVFQSPRKINTTFPLADRAMGYEPDISCRSALERFGTKLPRYAALDGSPEPSLSSNFDAGVTVLARARIPDCTVVDYDNNAFPGEMWSEMTVQEAPGRGLIFSAGSVLSSEILLSDENFSSMVRNVLDRMLASKR